jgi:hypothetical protein
LPYAIDYALSELITFSDHDWALPCAIAYALSGLRDLSSLLGKTCPCYGIASDISKIQSIIE